MEYAQAPSTPGLVEEPNLSSVQEALACDDHLEPEDHNLTELVAKENLENASSVSSLHYGDKVATDWTLLNDTNHDAVLSMPADENGYLLGEQKIKQAKPQGDSPSVAVTDQISSGNPILVSLLFSVLAQQLNPFLLHQNVQLGKLLHQMAKTGRKICRMEL